MFEIFIFCPKIQLWVTEKIFDFSWWKTRENVVVLNFLAVDNFDFTRKIVKKNLGEKLLKMLGFCQNWNFGQKFDFYNSVQGGDNKDYWISSYIIPLTWSRVTTFVPSYPLLLLSSALSSVQKGLVVGLSEVVAISLMVISVLMIPSGFCSSTVFENHRKSLIQLNESTMRAKRAKVHILSGQMLIKNAKNGPFWRIFENLALAAKQC